MTLVVERPVDRDLTIAGPDHGDGGVDVAVEPGSTRVDPNEPRFARLRLGLAWTWPTLLVLEVYSRFGGTGLSSPDDGFILAQSRRILSGQVPHRDFISPRPAGSALLHCIDFLLPLPLLSASRLVSTVEVVTYTLIFASLAYRKPLRSWSTVQVVAAAAAVFVNLHSFPLMAWHTIDGAFLVAIGVATLRSGLALNRSPRVYGGLLLLGSALVVKQSFAPALLLGIVIVWDHRRRFTGSRRTPSLRRAAVIVALPIVVYVLVIAAAGGFVPMVVQFANARPVWGWSVIKGVWGRGGQGFVLVASAVALCVIDGRLGRTPNVRRAARLGARGGLSALVVGVLLVTRTDPADAWGRALLLLLVVVVAWEWLADRRVDRFGMLMISVGWMTALSWGYPSPRLVAGSVAFVVLDRIWRDAPALPSRRAFAHAGRIAAVLGIVVSFALMATAIRERALLNAAVVSGDASIGSIVPDLRGVRTDLTATTLIRDVASCRARFPAHYTAVLPGPAIVSPMLKLDNPFSVDWVYPLEIAGSEQRLVDEAARLDAKGDYLVLVPRAAPGAQQPDNPVLDRMLDQLSGTRSQCGIFTAVHSA